MRRRESCGLLERAGRSDDMFERAEDSVEESLRLLEVLAARNDRLLMTALRRGGKGEEGSGRLARVVGASCDLLLL
jgi:hypothetical protein